MTNKLLLLIFSLLLNSCYRGIDLGDQTSINTFTSPYTDTSSAVSDCIAPLTKLAYPVGDSGVPGPIQKKVYPPFPWRQVAKVPFNLGKIDGDTIQSAVIHKNGGHDEVWVIPASYKGIYILNVETEEWRYQKNDEATYLISSLFIDKNNSVWGINSEENKTSLLLRFNSQTNKFDNVDDQDGFLKENIKQASIFDIHIDSHGIFWMTILNNDMTVDTRRYLLYKYNPFTSRSEKISLEYEFDGPFTIDSKDIIYLLDSNHGIVISLDPETMLSKPYDVLTKLNQSSGLDIFFDNNYRLWLSDIGWFDFAQDPKYPQWYEIIRSPVFLSYIETAGLWVWGPPKFTFEDSNKILWFASNNGTGWLDPSKGEWCIFTSFPSNVLSDSDSNLWLYTDDSLYKK